MDIKSESVCLEKLFSGIETTFTVPVYQRDYSWKLNQAEELFNDIYVSFTNKTPYFLGTIVLNTENNEDDKFDIIDGQQRLATFTILLSCIRNLASAIAEKNYTSSFSTLTINEEVLKKCKKIANISGGTLLHQSEPDHYYLRLNNKDGELFAADIQKEVEPLLTKEDFKIIPNDNRIIKVKKFFSSKLFDAFVKKEDGVSMLYDFLLHVIKKLLFLKIEVETDSDAYLLFESLNSKGLELSTSDLLKNRMLLSCSNEEQKQKVLKNWDDMISLLENSRYSPTDFLRFYWAAFQKNITKKELYKSIKDKLSAETVEALSKDFLKYAEFFQSMTSKELIFPSTNYRQDDIERHYAEINNLRYSICYPLFMRAHKERPEILPALVEKSKIFLFRIITVGGRSVGFASETFSNALTYIKGDVQEDGSIKIYSDEKIFQLFEKNDILDDDFRDCLKYKSFTDNNIAKYFLVNVELHKKGWTKIINQKEVHLEHILPQKHDKWKFTCGEKSIEDWVYTIGNMTLLERKLNQSIQNSPFKDKVQRYREHENLNEGTGVSITYDIFNKYQDKAYDWTRREISDRTDEFIKIATELWSCKSADV